jgi:hypothetical protein
MPKPMETEMRQTLLDGSNLRSLLLHLNPVAVALAWEALICEDFD